MEEKKSVTKEDLEQLIIDQIYEDGLDPEIARSATDLLKVLQEGRISEVKVENEKLRIDMEEAKSVRESESARMRAELEAESAKLRAELEAQEADKRTKRQLIGDGVKAGAQFACALVGGLIYGRLSGKIIKNEKNDILTPRSQAWSILSKLKF